MCVWVKSDIQLQLSRPDLYFFCNNLKAVACFIIILRFAAVEFLLSGLFQLGMLKCLLKADERQILPTAK